MPFDGKDGVATEVVEALDIMDKTIALLSDEKRWTKKAFHRVVYGVSGGRAVNSYCVLGAIGQNGGFCGNQFSSYQPKPVIAAALLEGIRKHSRAVNIPHRLPADGYLDPSIVARYNDAPRRTHKQIVQLLATTRSKIAERL